MISVNIQGAGIAGQVLYRELKQKGIASTLYEKQSFPKIKVCGGVLQSNSWQYLKSQFNLKEEGVAIHSISHFWRNKLIAKIPMNPPMFFCSRFNLDHEMYKNLNNPKKNALDTNPGIQVDAKGAQCSNGKFMAFQAKGPHVKNLEMRYGRGLYAGVSPTESTNSHIALIIKKELYKGTDALTERVASELGLKDLTEWKGIGGIAFGYSGKQIAIGDAMLTMHPFMGFGMGHAILSAQLMAKCIQENKVSEYPIAHRKMFRKYNWLSKSGFMLLDSPFRFVLWPVFRNHYLFRSVYKWIHKAASCRNQMELPLR